MKVCVDPGHGMGNRSAGVFDPGALGGGDSGREFREADIALKYGLTLKDVLRARGVEVFMTRDDNTDVAPLGRRAAAARAAGCGVFVSLHMNAVEDESAHGTEVLYRDDRDFAQRLQNALVPVLGLRDRGIKHRPELAVLAFQGTAALVELGFVTNDRDRDRILEPQVRAAVCEAIANVVAPGATVATASPLSAGSPGLALAIDGGTGDGPAPADASIEPKEHDWGGGDRRGYDIQSPVILGQEALTATSFQSTFGALGMTDGFDMPAFEAKVASWRLQYFSAAELLYLGGSHYASGSCRGKNSLPPHGLWNAMEQTAKMLDEIRRQFGHPIRILSGYRDTDYNRCVGGESNSYHTKYNALDFTNEGGTLREMYAIALRVRKQNPTKYMGGIGYYPGSRFVHIDTRGYEANW